jgi:hypothetical protein
MSKDFVLSVRASKFHSVRSPSSRQISPSGRSLERHVRCGGTSALRSTQLEISRHTRRKGILDRCDWGTERLVSGPDVLRRFGPRSGPGCGPSHAGTAGSGWFGRERWGTERLVSGPDVLRKLALDPVPAVDQAMLAPPGLSAW